LSMGYLDTEKNRIGEIFKRRNLIVHNGGRVSRRYLQEVHEEDLRRGLKLGDTVEITPDYLSRSIDLIEHEFILLAAELWKKLKPEDQRRGNLLSNLAVQHLNERRWIVARGFSFFAMNDKSQVEATRLSSQINYWQSYKWSGDFEKIRSEVDGADFSAKKPLFQLAHSALRDDFEAFFQLLPRLLESGELLKTQLASWPLFQGVRQRPEFAAFDQSDSERGGDEASELGVRVIGPRASDSIN
jgi:hypothetical protein